MKKTMIAASVALALTVSACGKNDAPANVVANDTALDGTIEDGLASNETDAGGNIAVGEEDGVLSNEIANGPDAAANLQ